MSWTTNPYEDTIIESVIPKTMGDAPYRKAAKVALPAMKVSSSSTNILENAKTNGMSIRVGNKLVKFQITEEIQLPEDEIRAEYEQILNNKVAEISKEFDTKAAELAYIADMARKDFEAKEKALNTRLINLKPMPEISFDHAKAGLSVVRGSKDGEYFWLYQTVYWPKFVDSRPISATYIKKMITPMTIVVSTQGDKVISVVTRKTIGLGKFDHYHNTGSGDCWGSWSFNPVWSTPSDIINICKDATAVLENINGNSLARRNPVGLPTYAAVRKNSVDAPVETKLSKNDERMGVVEADDRDEVTGGSWTT